MRRLWILSVIPMVLAVSACTQEAQDQLQSAVETAAPTIQAAAETAAPTVQAAAQQAATQVVGAVQTAQPTLEAVGTGIAAGVQTAAPTIEAAVGEVLTDTALAVNTWEWLGTTMADESKMLPDDPTSYTLDIKADGSVAIKADCNNAAGTIEVDGSAMALALGPMTLAACPEGSLGEDFVKQLGQVESFELQGNTLILTLADGATMELAAAATE